MRSLPGWTPAKNNHNQWQPFRAAHCSGLLWHVFRAIQDYSVTFSGQCRTTLAFFFRAIQDYFDTFLEQSTDYSTLSPIQGNPGLLWHLFRAIKDYCTLTGFQGNLGLLWHLFRAVQDYSDTFSGQFRITPSFFQGSSGLLRYFFRVVQDNSGIFSG